ncbi:MAG: REP element-mobilizing transposase RayT [Akkermansiaceae bacterium]|jgi:REP element-mobilizing transposase RayT
MKLVDKKLGQKAELTDLEKVDCLTGKAMGGIVLKAPGRGEGKRRRFVFTDRDSCYHVMSRVAGGDLLFGDVEKEAFRKLMRRMEFFSGLEILTYAVLGNHFHILVRVPCQEKFLRSFREGSREEREARLMEHLKSLYSKAYLRQLKGELSQMREKGMEDLFEKTLESFLKRMCSLERFMKELKERFSRWFNKRHGRRGTLWQERYKSVLVQDGEAAVTMAAYIDLNPLRAGLVADPKDYRWCGYAEAVGGSKRARVGICRVLGISRDRWRKDGAEIYRRILLTEGMEATEEPGRKKEGDSGLRRRGFRREDALAQLEGGGKLSRGELLRCRVRYFSEGMVLGSRGFVEEALLKRREWFGEKRKTGAHGLPISEGGLYSLRKLKGI